MKLNYITIMVNNLQESIDFYQNIVGLKIQRHFKPNDGMEIAFMANAEGETMLELIENKNAEAGRKLGFIMSFKPNAAIELVRQKAVYLGYYATQVYYANPPTKPAYFRVPDPDGVTVEIAYDETQNTSNEAIFSRNAEEIINMINDELELSECGKTKYNTQYLKKIINELRKMQQHLNSNEFSPCYPRVIADEWDCNDELFKALMSVANEYGKLRLEDKLYKGQIND